MDLPNKFVIYDTEYTTWEGAMDRGWSGPGEERELVQLGAITVEDGQEVDALLLYMQPRINPDLSDFFTELTGVTQAEVDEHGISFEAAYEQFMQWSDGLPKYSFGPDHAVIERNHEVYKTGVVLPVDEFNDIREYFKGCGVDTTQYMSSSIPEAFGATPPPAAHDALNDARSILVAINASNR